MQGGDFGNGATSLGSGTLHGGEDLQEGEGLHGGDAGEPDTCSSCLLEVDPMVYICSSCLHEDGESGDEIGSVSDAPNLGRVSDCARNSTGGVAGAVERNLSGIGGGSPCPAGRDRCEGPGEASLAVGLFSGESDERTE